MEELRGIKFRLLLHRNVGRSPAGCYSVTGGLFIEELLQAGKRYLITAVNVQRGSALFPFTPRIRLKFVRWSLTLLILDSGRGDE